MLRESPISTSGISSCDSVSDETSFCGDVLETPGIGLLLGPGAGAARD